MRTFFRYLLNTVVGVVFAAATVAALTPGFAALAGAETGGIMAAIPSGLFIVALLICVLAPSVRRAFGRGFLMLGTALFLLPITSMMLSARAFNETVTQASVNDQAMVAVGAGLAGGVITAMGTFIGLILGALFLLIGLVLSLGGRREVVVVSAPVR